MCMGAGFAVIVGIQALIRITTGTGLCWPKVTGRPMLRCCRAGKVLRKYNQMNIGRLALRQEGDNWNAYYALEETMEEAQFLGSIHMSLIVSSEQRKAEFIALMRECIADMVEESTGLRPNWGGPTTAPEHERSGNA